MTPAKYRQLIGFPSQASARVFLSGKDICPSIDFEYTNELIDRIALIIRKVDASIHESLRREDLESFITISLRSPYQTIKSTGIIRKLNNQGRRPEGVLFSWLRGYAISEYFIPLFAQIFKTELSNIERIGEDSLQDLDTFKRSPKADLSVQLSNKKVRIEVQSGFQGVNDIKKHKIIEAKNTITLHKEPTVCVHVDIYNGQVAFVRLDTIKEDSSHFTTRQQMEGQIVFQIDQNYFKWRLSDLPPTLDELELDI